jgi:putative Holliday junction resolvase
MRQGVRLAVDVGTVRIGVAKSDPYGILASPLETVARGAGDLDRIVALALEHAAIDVYVGRPAALSGRTTASTQDALGFAAALGERLPGVVRLIDERLTTVTAQARLRESGKDARRGRAVVDQAAAAIMLEHALDSERQAGKRPGDDVPTQSQD